MDLLLRILNISVILVKATKNIAKWVLREIKNRFVLQHFDGKLK